MKNRLRGCRFACCVRAQQSSNASLCSNESLAYTMPCRTANYVVAVQRGLKCDCSKEVLFEFRAELFEFVQGQIIQLATLVQAIPDSVANLLVRFAKGNTLIYKIRRCSH